MKNKKTLLIVLLLACILLITLMTIKHFTKEKVVVEKSITKIVYSYGGGFGTLADTATKSITLENTGKARFTNEYNSYIEDINISMSEYEKLYNYLNEHIDLFSRKLDIEDSIMDGWSSYLTIETEDGKTYKTGGYMVQDEDYKEIVEMIYKIVDRDRFNEYVNSIK